MILRHQISPNTSFQATLCLFKLGTLNNEIISTICFFLLPMSTNSCTKNSPSWNTLFHSKDVTEPAETLDVNALTYFQVVESIEKPFIRSYTKVIAQIRTG